MPLCPVTAHLDEEPDFSNLTEVAGDCCQLVLQSSTEQQGMPFAVKSNAVLLCLMLAHLHEEPDFSGLTEVARDCCQLVLQSSTEQQGKAFALKSGAVLLCLMTVTARLHRCDPGGTRPLSAGFAEQHRATRHAFGSEECCSAAVFGKFVLL